MLAASVAMWFLGSELRETVFGKHLGVAAVPAVIIVALWAPGLIVNKAFDIGADPALAWPIAFIVCFVVWTPAVHRLRLWFHSDRTVPYVLGGVLVFAWAVGSDVTLRQARGTWMGWEQLALLIVGIGSSGFVVVRALRRNRLGPNKSLHLPARGVRRV